MMDDTMTSLLSTISIMFVSSLAAGILPYKAVRITDAQLRLMSALGAGLLIGSALGVIIPEGFHSLPARGAHHDHQHEEHEHDGKHEAAAPAGLPGLVLVGGFLAMMMLERAQAATGSDGHCHHVHHAHSPPASPLPTGDGKDRNTDRHERSGQLRDDLNAARSVQALDNEAVELVDLPATDAKIRKGASFRLGCSCCVAPSSLLSGSLTGSFRFKTILCTIA
jgi:hypothetical protein